MTNQIRNVVGATTIAAALSLTPIIVAQTQTSSTTYVVVPNTTAPVYSTAPVAGPVVLAATANAPGAQGETAPSTSQKLIDNANAIQRRLLKDPATAHEIVYIRPENDQITLTGTVSSDAARDRIEGIANAASVTSRVVSRLKVAGQQ